MTTLAKLGQRQSVEKWMRQNNMDVLGLQATKVRHDGQENRQGYTWHFSGQSMPNKEKANANDKTTNRFDAGVGIVISTEHKNYIHKIIPINDRIIVIPKASFLRSTAGGVPSGATEGSSMGPAWDHSFLLFRAHFLDTFSEHFFMIFGPQNGPQNQPQNGPKISPFLSSRWGLLF